MCDDDGTRRIVRRKLLTLVEIAFRLNYKKKKYDKVLFVSKKQQSIKTGWGRYVFLTRVQCHPKPWYNIRERRLSTYVVYVYRVKQKR